MCTLASNRLAIHIFSSCHYHHHKLQQYLQYRRLWKRPFKQVLTFFTIFLDNGSPNERLSSNATVFMNLIDENDNVPMFTKRIYYIDIPEDHPVDSDLTKPIGKVTAVDADAGDNAAIKYSIIGGNKASVFSINSETGDIYLLQSLDREVQVMTQQNSV